MKGLSSYNGDVPSTMILTIVTEIDYDIFLPFTLGFFFFNIRILSSQDPPLHNWNIADKAKIQDNQLIKKRIINTREKKNIFVLVSMYLLYDKISTCLGEDSTGETIEIAS